MLQFWVVMPFFLLKLIECNFSDELLSCSSTQERSSVSVIEFVLEYISI